MKKTCTKAGMVVWLLFSLGLGLATESIQRKYVARRPFNCVVIGAI